MASKPAKPATVKTVSELQKSGLSGELAGLIQLIFIWCRAAFCLFAGRRKCSARGGTKVVSNHFCSAAVLS